jgi:hypothetical protein
MTTQDTAAPVGPSIDSRLGCSTISFRSWSLPGALAQISGQGFSEIDLGALPGVCDHVPTPLSAELVVTYRREAQTQRRVCDRPGEGEDVRLAGYLGGGPGLPAARGRREEGAPPAAVRSLLRCPRSRCCRQDRHDDERFRHSGPITRPASSSWTPPGAGPRGSGAPAPCTHCCQRNTCPMPSGTARRRSSTYHDSQLPCGPPICCVDGRAHVARRAPRSAAAGRSGASLAALPAWVPQPPHA